MSKNKKILPVRIQLSRRGGFNLQEASKNINGLPAVVCSRPSKWGNPFKIVGDMVYGDASHRRKIFDPFIFIEPDRNKSVVPDWMGAPIREIIIKLHENWLWGRDNNYIKPPPSINTIREHLAGKNLACWCRLHEKCHCDTLIHIANDENLLINVYDGMMLTSNEYLYLHEQIRWTHSIGQVLKSDEIGFYVSVTAVRGNPNDPPFIPDNKRIARELLTSGWKEITFSYRSDKLLP